MINRVISQIQIHLFTCYFAYFQEYALLFLDGSVDEEYE